MAQENEAKCIFCKIVRGEMPETKIVFESEAVIVFKDIRPASDFHYLAVPKQHIDNAKVLTVIHKPLRKYIIHCSILLMIDE